MNLIQPRNDRVLVRRIAEPTRIGSIIVPDIAKQKGILGEVVAVGPGKWVPGEWWSFYAGQRCHATVENGVFKSSPWEENREWRWIDGYREPIAVQPKQTVYFNSRWNDVEQLPGGMHLIQEADIFCIVPANARPATASSPDLPPLVQSIDPLAHA